MSLQKQNVPIIFGQGIDTKTDPKQQLLATFRKAKNVVYETIGSIKKRFGYDRILLETVSGEAVSGAQKIIAFKDELDVFADNVLYSFGETTSKLAPKGPVYSVFAETAPVFNGAFGATSCDMVSLEGIEVYAYSTSDGNVRYTILDSANNSFLASNNIVGQGTIARITAINGLIYIFVVDGTDIYFRRTSLLTPEILDTPVAVANNLNASFPVMDIFPATDKIIVAYGSSVASGRLRLVAVNSDSTLGSGFGVTGSPIPVAINVLLDSQNQVVVMFASATNLYYLIADEALTMLSLAQTLIESIAGVANIGVLELTDSNYTVWYEISAASEYDYLIRKAQVDDGGNIVVAPSVFIRSLGLLGKPFELDEVVNIPCVFGPSIQSSSFLLDSAASVIARFYSGTSSGLQTLGALTNVAVVSDTEAVLAARYKVRTESENGTFFSEFGVGRVGLESRADTPLQTAVLGDNLHIAGGILRAYDGDEVTEHGFNMYPDDIIEGSTTDTGGSMSDGDYGYVALYRWTDNYGQEHRSAVSGNLEVTLSGGTSTQTQEIEIPTLRVTDKSEVIIELYRTEDDGTIYYKTAEMLNDPTVDTITITDTRADDSLINEITLYIEGGVLDNGFAPSASVLATHTASSRVMAIAEDGNLLIYSKIRFPGAPVEWNEALTKVLDPIGGRARALASMDEKMIIFKEDAILFISGGGPNNLGQQDSFTEPERVSIDVGCIEPESVVLIPAGLMFKSRKGIHLLTRALQVMYLGAAVEEFNSAEITSAKIIGKFNQVRFTTRDNDCLVYNYNLNLWSTFDNHRAFSAEVIGSDYYYVRSSTELFKENPSSFSDNGSAISMLIETGWLSFAQMQGFQRVYKMLVLGDWKSAHQLRVRAAYNFNPAWIHEKILQPVSDVVSGETYGDDSPYGEDDTVYGGDGSPYQARFDFKKQKCQSIKLQFQDLQSIVGEGLSLSTFTLEVGGKAGLFKPKQSAVKGLR